MGMFDTFLNTDGSVAIQIKVGPNLMNEYHVGDHVGRDFQDGVIAGNEGYIIISEGIVRSVTEDYPADAPEDLPCITKWGGPFNPTSERIEDFNPIAQALRALKEP